VEIAVIVPSHQRRDLLIRVLAALAAQSIQAARFAVVVVCDGCTDGSAAAARTAAGAGGPAAGIRLTVLEQPNSGAATARNRGVAATDAPLLLFLDDDMIAAPDLVEAHLERHARQPGGIVLGAMPVHPDSPRSYLTVGLTRWSDRRHACLSDPGGQIPADEVLTGQMSLARETFERLGGFDVRYTAGGTFGGEDVELGWRARRLGIALLYEPRAVSHQVYAKSFRALCRNIRHAGAADMLMAADHPAIRPHLLLGQGSHLPPFQRLALGITLRAPALARLGAAPVLALLELADRRGWSAVVWERLHAVARAHLYGLGMLDAGRSGAASSRTA
jgi:GT2 family glycosyltransferase